MVVCDQCFDPVLKNKCVHSCEECRVGRRVFEGLNCVQKVGIYVYTDLAKLDEKEKAKIPAFAHIFDSLHIERHL